MSFQSRVDVSKILHFDDNRAKNFMSSFQKRHSQFILTTDYRTLNEDKENIDLDLVFDEVASKYKDIFGFDLSYMSFKVDRQPVYTNGEPCYEYDEDECGGDWTSLGWIRLNPDMRSVMDRYGVAWHSSDDVEEFTKIIIAHELAHEVWNHIADDQFKEDVLDEARMQSFNTTYLDSVKPSRLDEETFCEYLAHQVVKQRKSKIRSKMVFKKVQRNEIVPLLDEIETYIESKRFKR